MLSFVLVGGEWHVRGTVAELEGREYEYVDVARSDGTVVKRCIGPIKVVDGETALAIVLPGP